MIASIHRDKMSAFNTSTRKEDMSVRLKAHNLKSSKRETRQLELESQKMEDRLQELKMAMNREKEQRQSQGSYWKKGQYGSLKTYASEVLEKSQKPHSGDSKRVHVKVLKDEPLDLPTRSKAPGTIGYIAQRDRHSKIGRQKVKGPRCGQCEEKSAAVSCMQCSEDYCATCFAAFHIKGALKKHRTVPLQQANMPRQWMSPRGPAQVMNNEMDNGHCKADGELISEVIPYTNGHVVPDRNSPEGASGCYDGPSLLTGCYDEAHSAASFQQALSAWRTGDNASPDTSPQQKQSHQLDHQPGNNQQLTLTAKNYSVSTTECTTETPKLEPIEVNFHSTHSISYAERLLLKHHRRSPLQRLQTPRLNDYYDIDDLADEDGADHIDFQSLLDAVVPSVSPHSGSDSAVSVIELTEVNSGTDVAGIEQTNQCFVQEYDPTDVLPIINENGFMSPDSLCNPLTMSPVLDLPPQSFTTDHDSPGRGSAPLSTRRQTNATGTLDGEATTAAVKKTRILSGKVLQSRPQSRSQSRAQSHAKSRASSRAALFGEGLLTKSPSPSLSEIARLTFDPTLQYDGGLGEFFVSGVKLEEDVVSDIASKRPVSAAAINKPIKVSNRLYQMCPRSWHPDSSTAETWSLEDSQTDNHQATKRQDNHLMNQADDAGEEISISLRGPDDSGAFLTGFVVKPPVTPKSHQLSSRHRRIASPDVPSLDRNCSPCGVDQEIRSSRVLSDHRPVSRAIVMDGEDLSRYDHAGETDCTSAEDEQTLDQLEWELASEIGRIDESGKISRLSNHAGMDDVEIDEDEFQDRISRLSNYGPGYDITSSLSVREQELMYDFEEMELKFQHEEQEVKSLQS